MFLTEVVGEVGSLGFFIAIEARDLAIGRRINERHGRQKKISNFSRADVKGLETTAFSEYGKQARIHYWKNLKSFASLFSWSTRHGLQT
jgi:lipid-binding SYLF domain-containing protein